MLHVKIQRFIASLKLGLVTNAFDIIPDMAGEAVIIEAAVVNIDFERMLNDAGNLLDDLFRQLGPLVVRADVAVIDEMQRNAGNLLLRQLHPQFFLNQVNTIFANFIFSGVEVLNIIGKRNGNVNVLPLAFDGEFQMIPQCENEVCGDGTVVEPLGIIDDLCADHQQLVGQLAEDTEVLLIHIVVGAVDLGQGYFARELPKPNAFTVSNHFCAVLVPAQGKVVIDFF